MITEPKGLKRKFAVMLSRILSLYRVKHNEAFTSTDLGDSVRSVLICMPFDVNEFQAAVKTLDEIIRRFPRGKLTVVLQENFRGWIGRHYQISIFPLSDTDANFFHLPRRKLCCEVRKRNSVVAIDLNPEGSLFCSILCAVSGAKVRIGFAGDNSDYCYNFQVRTTNLEDIEGKYQVLLNYVN